MAFFKRDPRKKLRRAYEQKLEAAMHAMHRGDIRENAILTAEAEELRTELERLDSDQGS